LSKIGHKWSKIGVNIDKNGRKETLNCYRKTKIAKMVEYGEHWSKVGRKCSTLVKSECLGSKLVDSENHPVGTQSPKNHQK
jgi:hypothetical protein